MKRSARAPAPYARQGLDSVCEWQWSWPPPWPGLDWGRCLLMKWLRACISSSLSLSLDIGLLLKLNEYLKRRKAAKRERERKKTKAAKRNETKQNETFATAPFGATKDVFPLKAFAGKSCLNLATDTCVCSGWGRVRGQGRGTRRKTILKAMRHQQQHQHQQHQHHPHHLRSLGLVIVFRTCDTIADDIANKDTKFNDLQQAGEEREERRRSSSRKKYGSRNVNELHCECHCSLSLTDWVILFFSNEFK